MHRPQDATLAQWRDEFSIREFGDGALGEHFDAVERECSASRWPGGPGPHAELLREGSRALGWRTAEIPRAWRYPAGGSPFAGRRQSMSETLIPRARAAGAVVLAGARIAKLVLRGGRAVEARGTRDGAPLRVAFRACFVCAGAVQTPALLRRSGITAHVGNTLRLHPMVRVVARFAREMNDPSYGVPAEQVEEFKPRLTLGCSHSSVPHVALWLDGATEGRLARLREWRKHGVFYVAAVGSGVGRVRNLPGLGAPVVTMDVTDEDRRNLGDGIEKLGRLLFAAGALEVSNPVAGGAPFHVEADLDALRPGIPHGRAAVSTIHVFSSCPMGEDRSRCAVDSHGRVHDVPNLWVNDASILPRSPGVNPQETVLAVARRNAVAFAGG